MNAKINCNAFPFFKIKDVDLTTVNFEGSTDGYDGKERRNYSTLGFVAENANDQVEEIKKTFHLNPEYSKPEDYIWVKDQFEDYQKDKRPRVVIKLTNGSRGMINPPSFSFEK